MSVGETMSIGGVESGVPETLAAARGVLLELERGGLSGVSIGVGRAAGRRHRGCSLTMRMRAGLLCCLVVGGCYGGFSSLPPGGGGVGGGDGPQVDMGGDDEPAAPGDPDGRGGGAGLCGDCAVQSDCGGQGACVRNSETGERFCTEPCTRGSCQAGYSCRDLGVGVPLQCLPDGDTCRDDGGGPDPGGVDPVEPDPEDGGGDVGGGLLPEMSEQEQQLLGLMNQDRAASGRNCGDLEWNEGAARVAQRWAEHMAQSGMYHNPNFYEEIAAEGVDLSTAGENIAWAGDVVEAEDMFMSEGPGGGHYEAILSCDYSAVGVGVAQDGSGMVMVVQDFVGFGGGGGGW